MKILIGLVLVFGIGSCVGHNMAPEAKPEFIEVPRTKIIKVDAPPPEKVEIFPSVCEDALEYAFAVAGSAEEVYSSGRTQIQIFSDARKAIAEERQTSSIEVRQRRLHGETVGSLYNMEEAMSKFESSYEKCQESK